MNVFCVSTRRSTHARLFVDTSPPEGFLLLVSGRVGSSAIGWGEQTRAICYYERSVDPDQTRISREYLCRSDRVLFRGIPVSGFHPYAVVPNGKKCCVTPGRRRSGERPDGCEAIVQCKRRREHIQSRRPYRFKCDAESSTLASTLLPCAGRFVRGITTKEVVGGDHGTITKEVIASEVCSDDDSARVQF